MLPKKFINFEPQPDFPSYDISEHNAIMSSHYLETQPEATLRTHEVKESLPMFFMLGQAALAEAHVEVGKTKGEYEAFCRGYADVDYLALLLQSRKYTGSLQSGAASMNYFFLKDEGMADFHLSRRRFPWIAEHPKLIDLLHERSDTQKETPRQLSSRIIGAQIASELLYVEE